MSVFIRPAAMSLTGGIRTPSWKLSVARALKPPGTLPPMSSQCPTEAIQQNTAPSRNTGRTRRKSFRWVPPSYGSLNRNVSPGSSPPSAATLSITAFTANAMAPTKIGSPVVPCTSVAPVSAW